MPDQQADPSGPIRQNWYRVLDAGELPEGRVKQVTCGRRTVCMTHYDGQYVGVEHPVPVLPNSPPLLS